MDIELFKTIVDTSSITITSDIKDRDFANCFLLHEVIISDSVNDDAYIIPDTTIDDDVIYTSAFFTSETIWYNAFDCCTNLTEITIPKKVKYIDNCAFAGCKNLKTINMHKDVSFGNFKY